jgi:hypothetical protein
MKRIKDMTDDEFAKFRNRANSLAFTNRGKFIIELKEYRLFYKGFPIDKWEAYYFGFSAEAIISNSTKIDCKYNFVKSSLN